MSVSTGFFSLLEEDKTHETPEEISRPLFMRGNFLPKTANGFEFGLVSQQLLECCTLTRQMKDCLKRSGRYIVVNNLNYIKSSTACSRGRCSTFGISGTSKIVRNP